MRHGNSQRRNRKRPTGGRTGGQSRSRVYDSNGPDVRIRGTAHQVTEKYMTLAKDAVSGGNLVLAESYYQHAEHYQRIINSFEDEAQAKSENVSTRTPDGNTFNDDDDLSLPISVLGGNSDAEHEAGMATA